MPRLPQPGGDSGDWGTILNDYLSVSLNTDGTIQPTAITSAGAYSKPAAGIPATDLSSSIQNSLTAANSAVQSVNSKTGTAVSLATTDLIDTSIVSPTNSQVLTYNSSSNKWTNQTLSSGNQHVVSTKASSYTLTTSDEVILANAAAGAIILTLPTAISNHNMYYLKKIDNSGNTVTVATSGGQTIDGGSSAILQIQYASISVVSDGSNWYIV